MGKEESQLEKLQNELLEFITPENKGRALSILKELDKVSKRMITRDTRNAFKSSVKFVIQKNDL